MAARNPLNKRTNQKKGTQQDEKERRREEGEVRKAEYVALTPQQRIARLDARLGVGVGAVHERAKLEALMVLKKAPQEKVVAPKSIEAVAEGVGAEKELAQARKIVKRDKHSKQAPPASGEYVKKKAKS